MSLASLFRKSLILFAASAALGACTVEPAAAPSEECRTVEVRRRGDVEVCHQKCNDHGCHDHCEERARYSREHRCWVE